jgi:hypothetical protein
LTRASAAALALALAGCPEPRSPTEMPPLEPPVARQPVDDREPSEPVADTPAVPAIERSEGRVVVTTAASAEEILLVSGGVVWTQDGEIRAALADAEAPQVLAALTDPHGLTTDGRNIVWLGDDENGRYDLATKDVSEWPVVAGPGEQEGLAFADALYARSRPDAFWRIDGVGGPRAVSVVRLAFHADPAWKLLPGFAAAKRTLYFPVADRNAKAHLLVRFAINPAKTTAIALQRSPDRFTWSVAANGDVVLVADERGTIVRVAARERTTSELFVHPGATHVCWCGADVCMFTAAGHVARRSPSEAEARAVADDARGATAIACDRERVAWASPIEPAGSRITVVDLR